MTPDGDVWWRGSERASGGSRRLAGQPLDEPQRQTGRPRERALHRRRRPDPVARSGLGQPGRRADQRVSFWRPPRDDGAAGGRSARLDARRLHGRDDGLRTTAATSSRSASSPRPFAICRSAVSLGTTSTLASSGALNPPKIQRTVQARRDGSSCGRLRRERGCEMDRSTLGSKAGSKDLRSASCRLRSRLEGPSIFGDTFKKLLPVDRAPVRRNEDPRPSIR